MPRQRLERSNQRLGDPRDIHLYLSLALLEIRRDIGAI